MKRETLKIILLVLSIGLIIGSAYAVVTALRPLNVGQFIWGIIGIASGIFAVWIYLTKP
jgi:hypothetical protein